MIIISRPIYFYFIFCEILYNIIYILLNFPFFFGVSLLILILRTLLYIFSHNFFIIIIIIIFFIIINFCDKLVNFYVLGWLLYQRIFNTFRSLPYPCSKLSHTLYYFHILFPYFKLYGHNCLYCHYMGRIKIILILILILRYIKPQDGSTI